MKYWDKSWNPITGCSPCSPGCINCWAQKMAYRLKGRYGYPKDDPFRVTFHFEKAEQPLGWKKSKKVFVCLMSDIFHEDIKRDDRARIFRAMMAANWHTYLILTKRIQNAFEYDFIFKNNRYWWLGVTVEDHKNKDRIDILRQIPSVFRWLSLEPLLEDLGTLDLTGIHWVTLGGETGPKARPMQIEWARSIADRCRMVGVPLFVKQLHLPTPKGFRISANPEEWPEELQVREMPNAV